MRSLKELTDTRSAVRGPMGRLSQPGWRDLTPWRRIVTQEANLLLAHLSHLHPGLNAGFSLYAAQVALCAGFIYWFLRIFIARRAPEHHRQHDHQGDGVEHHHDRAAQLLIGDRR